MPHINFDSPPKFKVLSVQFSNQSIKISRLVDYRALYPIFQLASETKVSKLEGSSFGNMPSMYVLKSQYDVSAQKVPRTVILVVKTFYHGTVMD